MCGGEGMGATQGQVPSEERHNKNSRVMANVTNLQAWDHGSPAGHPQSAAGHSKGMLSRDASKIDAAASILLL